MAKLTAAKRRKLPAKDFALGKGHYPINDEKHARAALARVSEYGSPQEKKEVEEKVHRKFPGLTLKGFANKKEKRESKRKAHGKGAKRKGMSLKRY